ncbi:MAG: succinate dehydrogenase assembly factor 2 [Gammaproteobacteria bacterium]|nr:succinate dehydrogenase assembly factor 2 [Gammaproteobacteria bacterium]
MDVARKRLLWHCRRGMRELDVVLEAWVASRYDASTIDQRACFDKLLDEADPTLYAWFTERAQPDDPDTRDLIMIMLAHYRATLHG